MLIVYKGEAMYYVIVVVSIFFILYYSLIKLSNELDASDYRVSAKKLLIPLILLGGLIYVNIQVFLIDLNVFVTPGIVGLIIAYTYPIIYYLTNQNSKADFLHSYDFVWGIYSVIELILIEEILGTLLGNSIVYHLIYTVVLIVFLLPSVLMIAYYALYKKIIDVATVQTVYYTQKFEMIEFFKTFSAFEKVSIGAYISSFFIGLALLSVFSVIANPLKLSEFIISIVLFCGITYFVVKVKDKNSLIKRTGLIKIILDFHRFQKELKQYNVKHEKALHNTHFSTAFKNGEGSTFILVIGESANTGHLSALCEYHRETTPWLSEMSREGRILTYKNMYSSFVQTAKVMELALTSANQYNDISFIDAISIIDAAKACGFETYWYSNQGVANVENTVVSIIGKKADHHRWTLEDYTMVPYDEVLLEYLRAVPKTNSNKLIVLHLKGSHVGFTERYPKKFEVWPVEKKELSSKNAYDNSILYTDYVLKSIFEYGKSTLNLQAMVYFSDHGTPIGTKRVPYFDGFDTVRVPFFVYLSNEYKHKYSETYEVLMKHKEYYITNDLVFNLMLGLMQIKCNKVSFKDDFTKAEYKYTKESLKTNLGSVSISDDIER